MEVYIDTSSEGYGANLLGDSKIVAMFSCSSSKQYAHSSTSVFEGLVRTLRAFRLILLGQNEQEIFRQLEYFEGAAE